MTWLNTNAVHNFLNMAIVLVSALGAMDWAGIVEAELAVKIVGGLAAAKLIMNAVRDGLKGMVKPQPPVETK